MDERVRALTRPPLHHFFGYYGVNPWAPDLRSHLALETTFHEHRPTSRDRAAVGLVDAETGALRPYAETPAFNLQQGSMMHWIDAGHGPEFTFNDWEEGRLVSRAVDPDTGVLRTVDGAIAAVAPDGAHALGLNYVRMSKCRAVVGYDLQPDVPLDELHPENDGLFALDLTTGARTLLLPIAEVIRARPDPQTRDGAAWFNHVIYRPDGERIVFMCRIKKPDGGFWDSLWTVWRGGTDLRCLADYRFRTSHFAWMDEGHLLCSTSVLGSGLQFVRIADAEGGGDVAPFGVGYLPGDGHACLSPDGRWIACDSYPTGPGRTAELMLYRPEDDTRVVLGRFHHEAQFTGDIRCDLHPRWRPDGTAVTFDSVHEGTRQVYIADVAEVVG